MLMVTSPPRETVEHGGVLNPGRSGRTGLDSSQLYTQTVKLLQAPMEAQSLPTTWCLKVSTQRTKIMASGGWGPRRELRKKEGAVVLDKETIDVSAFSPSLN